MVIGIIGENCSGKSTLAEKIGSRFNAEIITGKDYLRMAKSQSEAEALFRAKLENKHGMFDDGTYDLRFDGVNGDAEYLCADLEYLTGMNKLL